MDPRQMRCVVLGKLSPMERENVYEFLLANQVEFVQNPENNTYVAKVHVIQKTGHRESKAGVSFDGVRTSSRQLQLATPRSAPFSSPRTALESSIAPTQSDSVQGNRLKPLGTAALFASAMKRGKHREEDSAVPGVQNARLAAVLSVQAELSRRYKHFCGLLPPLSKAPKSMQRPELLRLVEDLYVARFAEEVQQLKRDAAGGKFSARKGDSGPTNEKLGFPHFVVAFLEKRYGLKPVVAQCCWSIVNSANQLRGLHTGAELFARFLDEAFDDLDLLFLLNTRSNVRQAMLTDKRRAANCSPWQKVWQKDFLPVDPEAVVGGEASSPREMAARPRESLDARQCLQVVRESVGKKELQEALMMRLNSELAASSLDGLEGGAIDVDRFLLVATEEFHRDRGLLEVDPRLQELIEVLQCQYGENLADAFHAMDHKRRGCITYSEFAKALKATEFDGDAHDVWELIDRDGDGAITVEDFLAMASYQPPERDHSAADANEGFRWSSWNSNLDPSVLQEARNLEQRLLASLAERGEAGRARPAEVRGWAVNVALGRHCAKSQRNRRQDPSTYSVSPQDLQAAWWAFDGEKAEAASPELRDHALTQEDDVEATVRQLLSSAVEELVSESLDAALSKCGHQPAYGETFIREALMCEFAPMGDALVEALVAGNCNAWLQELGIEGHGGKAQRDYFFRCQSALQASLSATVSAGAVERLCHLVAGTAELKAAAHARAEQMVAGSRAVSSSKMALPPPRSATSVLLRGPCFFEGLQEELKAGGGPRAEGKEEAAEAPEVEKAKRQDAGQETAHLPMDLLVEDKEQAAAKNKEKVSLADTPKQTERADSPPEAAAREDPVPAEEEATKDGGNAEAVAVTEEDPASAQEEEEAPKAVAEVAEEGMEVKEPREEREEAPAAEEAKEVKEEVKADEAGEAEEREEVADKQEPAESEKEEAAVGQEPKTADEST